MHECTGTIEEKVAEKTTKLENKYDRTGSLPVRCQMKTLKPENLYYPSGSAFYLQESSSLISQKFWFYEFKVSFLINTRRFHHLALVLLFCDQRRAPPKSCAVEACPHDLLHFRHFLRRRSPLPQLLSAALRQESPSVGPEAIAVPQGAGFGPQDRAFVPMKFPPPPKGLPGEHRRQPNRHDSEEIHEAAGAAAEDRRAFSRSLPRRLREPRAPIARILEECRVSAVHSSGKRRLLRHGVLGLLSRHRPLPRQPKSIDGLREATGRTF